MRWLYRKLIERTPWLAIIAAILLGPVLAMAYMNRGRLALLYLTIILLTIGAQLYALYIIPQHEKDISLIGDGLIILLTGISAIHTFIIARNFHDAKLRWFARFMPPLLTVTVIFIFAAIPFRTFVYEPFNVPSKSMMPTISVGDTFFAKKFAYGYSRYSLPFNPLIFTGKLFKKEPQRGDIVIFDRHDMPNISFIKRVIGMPHDKIQIIDGKLHINEKNVTTTFIKTKNFGTDTFDVYAETLDNGKTYYIWNQHNPRNMGNTPQYTVPKNHYFVMGDNRNNSMDSRSMGTIGFVHEDQIIAQADTLYYDGTLNTFVWQHID